jgi:hypothetical protein
MLTLKKKSYKVESKLYMYCFIAKLNITGYSTIYFKLKKLKSDFYKYIVSWQSETL